MLLSSGMDSAVLVPYMPPGSIAYTLFHPRLKTNELDAAKYYCKKFGMEHRAIPIDPSQYIEVIEPLLRRKRMPLSPAEPQFYIAAMIAARDGFRGVVTGGGADTKLGGFPALRKNIPVKRYVDKLQRTYLHPGRILKEGVSVDYLMEEYCHGGTKPTPLVDSRRFLAEVGVERFAFDNAIQAAGIDHIAPFNVFGIDFDEEINKIQSKYPIQEMYNAIYGCNPPDKKGFQKPAFLLKDYSPQSDIFADFDIDDLKYHQKFLVYCLERYHLKCIS